MFLRLDVLLEGSTGKNISFLQCLSSSSSRAPGELDGHQGDPPGGHGVPTEIPGGHHGGAAQRRGAVCGRRQENSGHGEGRRYQAGADIQRMQLVWILLQSLLLGRLYQRRRVLMLLGLAGRWVMKLVAAAR